MGERGSILDRFRHLKSTPVSMLDSSTYTRVTGSVSIQIFPTVPHRYGELYALMVNPTQQTSSAKKFKVLERVKHDGTSFV